jgi:ribosomal protein L40E
MGETLVNVLVAAAILGGAALLTHLFARAMYATCRRCGALNARRRSACRKCGETLKKIRPGAA